VCVQEKHFFCGMSGDERMELARSPSFLQNVYVESP
jgi:hypothetical protein